MTDFARALAQLPDAHVASAVALLHSKTPGFYYISADLAAAPSGLRLNAPLSVLSLCAPATLSVGMEMRVSFGQLTRSGVSVGSWTLTLTRKDDQAVKTPPGWDALERAAAKLDPSALRRPLGEAINRAPGALCIEAGLLGKLSPKTAADGTEMDPLQQGAMMLCLRVAEHADSADISWMSCVQGSGVYTTWTASVRQDEKSKHVA